MSGNIIILSGGASGVSSLTFVDGDLDASVSIPVTAQAGDLAVFWEWGSNGGSVSVPIGFTFLHSNGPSSDNLAIWSYRVLESGDIGDTVGGVVLGSARCIMIFRPNAVITSVGGGAWNGQITSGNPSSQTVLSGAAQAPLIVFGSIGRETGSADVEFSTQSPSFTEDFGLAGALAAYRIYNSSPSNHTVDCADLGLTNTLQSGYLTVS